MADVKKDPPKDKSIDWQALCERYNQNLPQGYVKAYEFGPREFIQYEPGPLYR